MINPVLLSDEPVGPEQDGLGFAPYAATLAEAAMSSPGPLTMGVFGEWGTGKSSLMKMMCEYLSTQYGERVLTVSFNAWRYEQDGHPLVPLIGRIVQALRDRQAFMDRLNSAGGAGNAVLEGLLKTAAASGGRSGQDAVDQAALDAFQPGANEIDGLLARSLYFNAFEQLDRVELPEDVRVVVIIDDLDRCFPDRAISLLEHIKLVLSQRGFVFVLGVARTVIEGYLQHRYQEKYGLTEFDGTRYLDKIVQIPFSIPPHRDRFGDFSATIVNRLRLEDADPFRDFVPILGSACQHNPRAIIRLLNNVIIDQSITERRPDLPRLEAGFFAVTRALQQGWPSIFTLLSASDELCRHAHGWGVGHGGELDSDDEQLVSRLRDVSREPGTEEPQPADEAAALAGRQLAGRMRADANLRALLFSQFGRRWLNDDFGRAAATRFVGERQVAQKGSEAPRDALDVLLLYLPSDLTPASDLAGVLRDAGVTVRERALQGSGLEVVESSEQLPFTRLLLYLHGEREPDPKTKVEIARELEGTWGSVLEQNPVATNMSALLPGADQEKLPELLRYQTSLRISDLPPVKGDLGPLLQRFVR